LLLARSAELPSLAGELIEKSKGLLGGESEQVRSVVLNSTSLSIWDRQPLEAVDATTIGTSYSQQVESASPRFSGRKRRRSSSKEQTQTPRKVYAMDKLIEVDSNPAFFELFLRFEGASLCLVARGEEDFKRWMEAFSAYDMTGTATLSSRLWRTDDSCDQKQTAVTAHEAKPKSKPLPTLLDHRQNQSSSKSTFDLCGDEAYDPGCVEGKAIRSSMGMRDQRKGLSNRSYL
jgi:hypothetical protein